MKKIYLLIMLISIICLTSCSLKHIDDINGENDYNLCTITDENILKDNKVVKSMSSYSNVNGLIRYKSSKFSGVESLTTIYSSSKDMHYVFNFTVEKGNAVVAIICDDDIIEKIEANSNNEFVFLKNIKYEIKLAGETAKYNLEITLKK